MTGPQVLAASRTGRRYLSRRKNVKAESGSPLVLTSPLPIIYGAFRSGDLPQNPPLELEVRAPSHARTKVANPFRYAPSGELT